MRASLYTEREDGELKTCLDEESGLDAPWEKQKRRLKGILESYWVIPKVKPRMKMIPRKENDVYLVKPRFIIH